VEARGCSLPLVPPLRIAERGTGGEAASQSRFDILRCNRGLRSTDEGVDAEGAPLPVPPSGFAIGVVNGLLYVGGGNQGMNDVADVEAYHS
jgi:hypothetical protein